MRDFKTLKYPKSRVATFDVGKIGNKKHHICGLLEVDVTEPRRRIREMIKSGKNVSFTAWLIKVISMTIEENPSVQALNYRKHSQIAFGSVDFSLPLEREVDGVKVPLAALIRDTNKKSIEEIDREIRTAVSRPIDGGKDYVLTHRKNDSLTNLFFNLPQFLRMVIWKFITRNPFRMKENMGTVILTNMGMTGSAPGWILPKSMHNLCFGMGSIVKKPWVVKDNIEIRHIMHLTILFDHDAVDGAPAAIFTDKLVRNIQASEEI